MAVKKIEMRPKGTGDYADILYPKTSADMVVVANAQTTQVSVDAVIIELYPRLNDSIILHWMGV